MATHITLLPLLMALLLAQALSATINNDLLVAIEEMRRANYFTFVTLLNLSPPDLFHANVTFLMPNDRMLANTTMPEAAISGFLLRHSIPSPLLFNHLEHIPSDSVIPTNFPDYELKISNNGRRSYFLNNVKIVSINICTAGSSIRCHGIDGVLQEDSSDPLGVCSNGTSPLAAATPPAPSLPSPSAETAPASAPAPLSDANVGPQKSGSASKWIFYGRSVEFVVICMMSILCL